MPSSEFNTAYEQASKLKEKPSQDDQLEIYALAKIAQGQEVKAPGTFDFAGKYKHKAWKEKKDAGMTAEEADKQYVAKINEFKTKYGFTG